MKLTDEKITALLDRLVASQDAETWRAQRRKDREHWAEWIDPDALKSLNDDQLKERFLEYFNSGAGRHPFNAIYRDRIIRDISKFRHTVQYLLDERIPVEQRLNQILNGSGTYHIEGIGKGLATSFLMDLDPDKYCTWNNKINMGLEAIGLSPAFNRGDGWGERYNVILGTLAHIKSLRPGLNFLDVDHFLHIVSAEQEGIEAVKEIVEGKTTIESVEESIRTITGEQAKIEFVMEKYLEEFIEANFNKIDFGAKLELYQDEESSGRQYPTTVANIDLLAIDKTNKEFVVIELKKGKGSDMVIGQILRYMGWVKENLAQHGESVRGIVIASERDERIQYALKMIPTVSLFLYRVSFELNKVGD